MHRDTHTHTHIWFSMFHSKSLVWARLALEVDPTPHLQSRLQSEAASMSKHVPHIPSNLLKQHHSYVMLSYHFGLIYNVRFKIVQSSRLSQHKKHCNIEQVRFLMCWCWLRESLNIFNSTQQHRPLAVTAISWFHSSAHVFAASCFPTTNDTIRRRWSIENDLANTRMHRDTHTHTSEGGIFHSKSLVWARLALEVDPTPHLQSRLQSEAASMSKHVPHIPSHLLKPYYSYVMLLHMLYHTFWYTLLGTRWFKNGSAQ